MSTAMIYLDERGLPRDELVQRSLRAATGFSRMGIGEGDTVALMLRNDFAFFEVLQAAAAIGAYAVPLNWHGKAEEACYILNDSRPKVLVAHADLLAPMRDQIPPGIELLVVPTPPEVQRRYGIAEDACQVAPGDVSWPQWADAFEPWAEPPRSCANKAVRRVK